MSKPDVSSLHNAQVLSIALRAGSMAIMVNMAMLAAADAAGLVTARGGLLKLITTILSSWMYQVGENAAASWVVGLTGNYVVQVLFHFFVGLLMAIVLVKLAADYFVKSAWYVGLVAAIVVWTMNAAVILPLLGEGVAGSRTVSVMGIIYFAVAHTAFFITLSLRARRLVMQSSIYG